MICFFIILFLLGLAAFTIKVPLLIAIWQSFALEAEKAHDSNTQASQEEASPEPLLSPSLSESPSNMRRDVELGLVFSDTPPEEEQDDLQQIKGVASVLEGKLHAFGIYTYKQIANWDDKTAEAFAERLSFKDRIHRDQWREQCAELHREKYGEALSV